MTTGNARAAVTGLVLLLAAGPCSTAWAQNMGHKLGRGCMNVVTGWVELPKGVRDGSQEENPFIGIPVGLCKGLALAVLRTGVGALEVVTFPAPWPKAQFAPVYEPVYVWD